MKVFLIVAGQFIALAVYGSPAVCAEIMWEVRRLESLEYPLLAAQSRSEARVVLRCEIEDGAVKSAEVISPVSKMPGIQLLVQAAIENVKKWRFRASLDPEAEPSPLTIIYDFRLAGQCEGPCKTTVKVDLPDLVTVIGQYRPLSAP